MGSLLKIPTGVLLTPIGASLFTEDWETPDISSDPNGVDSSVNPTGWVRATQGFGANRMALDYGDTSGNWTTTATDKQAWNLSYTNSGITTAQGEIGTIDVNFVTYEVKIKYQYDLGVINYNGGSGTASGWYSFKLLAVDNGVYDRTDVRAGGLAVGTVLAETTGSVDNDGQFHEITLQYTTSPTVDASVVGQDLTLVILGGTSSAVVGDVNIGKSGRLIGSPPYTPKVVRSVVAWYDAMDSATITLGSQGVSNWSDKSGNENHLTQGTASNEPLYNASDSNLNDLPTVSGDNTLRTLVMSSEAEPVKRVYCVVYHADDGGNWTSHNSMFYSTDGNVRLTGRNGGSNVFDGSQDGKNFDYRESTGATTYRNGSTTNTNKEVNGLPIPGDIFVVTSPISHTKTWRLFGGAQSWTYWEGGIAEFIFTDGSEDLATQQKIEGYLAWKWRLVDSLDVSHPYKSILPTI